MRRASQNCPRRSRIYWRGRAASTNISRYQPPRENVMPDEPAARTPGAKRAAPGEYVFDLGTVAEDHGRPRLFDGTRTMRRGRPHDRRPDAYESRHRRRAAFASQRTMDLCAGRNLPRQHRRQGNRCDDRARSSTFRPTPCMPARQRPMATLCSLPSRTPRTACTASRHLIVAQREHSRISGAHHNTRGGLQ